MTQKLPSTQFSFNGGELSPRLYGRTDIDKYRSGVETATNVICLPQGPFVKRNGSKFIHEVKDSTKKTRLIRFQKAVDDNYILEMGDLYIRILQGGTTADYVQRSSGTTDSTTASKLEDSTADFVTDGVAVGDRVFNRTDLTSTTVTAVDDLNTLSLNDDIFVSGEDYYITPEITTTYTEAEIFDIEYAQFGDDLYFVHSAHAPARFHRYSDVGWLLEDLTFTSVASVEDGEKPATTLTPAATSGSAVVFTAGAACFLANDVGRQLIYRSATTDQLLGKAIIVGYSSTTSVTADITTTFPSTAAIASGDWKIDLSPNTTITPSAAGTNLGDTCTVTTVANTWKDNAQHSYVGKYIHVNNGIVRIDAVATALSCSGEVVKAMDSVTATDDWTLQEESWTSARGYPNSVGFFEERLWFGGTTEQPQNLWGSVSNDFSNFGAGANDSDALDLLISDSIASPISWISSGRDFIVGGSGAEFTIGSSGGFITPSDRTIRVRSTHGSSVQQPQRIDTETLFVDSSGNKIRAVRYDFDTDTYIADDLTFFADHMTKDKRNPGIKETAVAQAPNNIIYAVMNNGDMLVGQFNRAQQVNGWERFQTKGDYESVATITVGDHDEVWVVVQRLINGTQVRYIERFDEFDSNDGLDPADGFTDSFTTFGTAISVTTISGSGSQLSSGTNTTVTANKLIDSGATFSSDGVEPGDTVTNVDTGLTTYVTAVDSETSLSINDDRFTSTATNYNVIESPKVTIPSGHGLVDGDEIIFYDALYNDDDGTLQEMDDVNGKTFYVINQGATTINLRKTNGATWKTYNSGGSIYKKVTSITGLDHLEGEEVLVKQDNGAAPNRTVTSGAITLTTASGVTQVGLAYTATVKTLALPDSGQVAIAGVEKRFINPVIRIYQSVLPTVNTQLLPIRDSSMLMNVAPDLYTGDAEYAATGWEDDGKITITDTSPFPLMINAIFGTVEIGEI